MLLLTFTPEQSALLCECLESLLTEIKSMLSDGSVGTTPQALHLAGDFAKIALRKLRCGNSYFDVSEQNAVFIALSYQSDYLNELLERAPLSEERNQMIDRLRAIRCLSRTLRQNGA